MSAKPRPCRWRLCGNPTQNGYLFCPQHEQQWAQDKAAHEPERIERQFVRHTYATDSKLPYRPASLDPDPKPARDYSQPPINRVLAALNNAGCEYRASTTDVDSYGAQCPAHEDRSPSLNVTRKSDGKVLMHCWAGCSVESVLYALGLEWRDLWEASEHDAGRKRVVKPFLPPHLRRAMEEALRRDDEDRKAAA